MSRIGKTPIDVPKAVTVDVTSDLVTVKGPKGERKLPVRSEIKVELNDATLTVCLLYTSPSPRDLSTSRMPSSA